MGGKQYRAYPTSGSCASLYTVPAILPAQYASISSGIWFQGLSVDRGHLDVFKALTAVAVLCYRCRWLRNLMMSHAFYHSTLRSIPPAALGVIILHLPKAWRRLQYLAESARESNMCLMAAVQMREERFAEMFPEYPKWRCWTDGQTETQVGCETYAPVARLLYKQGLL